MSSRSYRFTFRFDASDQGITIMRLHKSIVSLLFSVLEILLDCFISKLKGAVTLFEAPQFIVSKTLCMTANRKMLHIELFFMKKHNEH